MAVDMSIFKFGSIVYTDGGRNLL
ncbi:uncharacterized protein G2W53_010441 [Senna tora]|uniref:Uncharacterized protein n=1 Tax=Senna tora TaxID=362788 RepID=A0A834WZM4_9FABA|nr:uncharacterized protein G2W53_010441 [Senna tora]